MVFDMLVLQKHNTEMTAAAGEAFYTLVCLHQVCILLMLMFCIVHVIKCFVLFMLSNINAIIHDN